ncbi:hypothetical protein N431DRAFT_449599 [Stipitochalara longipes BDJ]|nr:hypothetical protein N431DRAFT_449599 [Stipitochalara longipes BDJ]
MHFSKFSMLSIIAFISTALACVDFSANLQEPVDNDETCPFAAALTDNGQQKCQLQVSGLFCGGPDRDDTLQLSCLDGYSATVDLSTWVVTYWYGSFWGQFQTNLDRQGYWVAKVWGC